MRILIVGSGGREHALAWKLSQEAEVHAAPGNPGVATCATCHPADPRDIAEIVELARKLRPDLVVVGPEDPLIAGMGDALRAAGFAVFGPNADGARLEGSKGYAKELMRAAGVPTAQSATCRDVDSAVSFIHALAEQGKNVVVKANGAALGKGVLVCSSPTEAESAVRRALVDREFGDAGDTVVVEERLEGNEFSLLSLCSGTDFVSLPVAQDYKRAYDNDQGPNTGGMGSVSPSPSVSPDLVAETERTIVAPILNELSKRCIDFRGVLFSGLMVQGGKAYCLEYNVRFGDPETQSILPRLGQGFAEALLACATGRPPEQIPVSNEEAVTVVLASGGYPGTYAKGVPIQISSGFPKSALLFHAGTKMTTEGLVTSGGRVLAVTALGSSIREAQRLAYEAASHVSFDGVQYRKDIAAL